MRVFASPDELLSAVGEDLGAGDWLTIDQERIDKFAEATGDEQWIHTDPVRAKDGPFGATIAHGFLTLSLMAALSKDLMTVERTKLVVNYGLDKVRFMKPVPVDSRVRASVVLSGVTVVGGGVQVSRTVTFEVEGEAKPACVAENLVRYYRS